MTDPGTLIQPHAETIVAALAKALDSPDPRAKLQAATLLLRLAQAEPDQNMANPAATSCPARHAPLAAAPARDTPPAESATNPMSPEPPPSPLGSDSPRGGADPISRRLLPNRHSADDAIR